MKKILLTSFILALGLLYTGCKDDNSANGGGGEILPEQQLSCELFMPTEGATVTLSDKLIIRGEGESNYGKIISAELKVGGNVITDISSVPFYYEYKFPKDTEPGELKIELAIKGDHDGTAFSSITVVTEYGNRPAPPEMGEDLIDVRDGNVYKTVQLGEQLWMAENLRYLPEQHFTVSSTEPRYYVMFDNDVKTELGKGFLNTYGAYYNWPAALQGEAGAGAEETHTIKGVCPAGWHLPSQKEWQTLSKYVFDSGMAAITNEGIVDETALGKALASTTMWMLPSETEIEPQPTWVGVNMEENNATFFNGLPVGFRACAGDEVWMHSCYSAGWWSCTHGEQMGADFGITVRIWSDLHTFVTNSEFNPGVGLPIRCIRNK